MKFSFKKQFSINSNRILISFLLTVILLVSGVIIYSFLNKTDNAKEIVRFKNQLEINRKYNKKRKEIQVETNKTNDSGFKKKLFDNQELIIENPFKPLLKLTNSRSNTKLETIRTNQKRKIIKKQDKINSKNQIKILGILGNNIHRRAIIEINNSEVYIVKIGFRLKGFEVININNEKVVLKKGEEYFIYVFEENRD